MSAESGFAWRMARYYGPEISQLPRAERLNFIRERMQILIETIRKDQLAHNDVCEDCQGGDLCLTAMSFTPQQRAWSDEIVCLQNYNAAEQRDEEYAKEARARGVIYKHHVDGFCQYWQNVRARLFEVANHRCQICGATEPLEAHHLHYDTLGFEEIGDLTAVCRTCHKDADASRRFRSGLATYAYKKYGEYWQEDQPIECLEEEFDRWLESRSDDDRDDDRDDDWD